MILSKQFGRQLCFLLAGAMAGASLLVAAEDTTATVVQSSSEEIAQLRALLAAQQKQLETLQHTMEQQQKLLEKAVDSASAQQTLRPNLGSVASITPVLPAPAAALPAIPALPAPRPQAPPAASGGNPSGGNPCEAAPDGNAVPPYLRIGSTCIVPVGFMDLTSVWRDKNAASSMGSNFGSIPYNNTVNGNLSEFRFSPQNSRLGLRVDGDWKGVHFIGYNEIDFNGTSGSGAITVSNGAFVPRLRLFWVDARKDKIEFLAGQSWSLLTPNRKGLSALPADLFYTQVVDINYMAGLTWTRQPGMRVLLHPNEKVTFGFSAEQPDQYIGGSAGGSGITLPSSFISIAPSSTQTGTQLDNAANIGITNLALAAPTVSPDFIAKIAFDPNTRFHFEVGGIERNFKIVNPALLTQKFSTTGAGLLVGLNAEVVKNLRVISTNFYSDGGGRYLFGQAPDLIVRADGSLSPVRANGTIDGIEATIKNTLLYAYYGGIYIGRNTAYDTNGKTLVGYGYTGSPNSQNRAINELTFGFNQTIWKDPRYGAINLMGQYEWLERDPWFVALGSPKNTHDSTIYVNVRYTLPGSMPNF
jgi:hypothetical protein